MSQATTGAVIAPTHSSLRLISACTIGNALEFYDFVIFSFFARTIGQLFFFLAVTRQRNCCSRSRPTASDSFCDRSAAWFLAPMPTAAGVSARQS